jgi:2-phospho-L-lactate guanylyltransferase
LAAGVRLATKRWPLATPVALLADLPALTVGEVVEALSQIEPDGAARFVADAAGTGSTLYAANATSFAPRFGPGSRAAHLAAGAIEIEGALAGLRQDVDDAPDLTRALTLGVGPLTRAALHDK